MSEDQRWYERGQAVYERWQWFYDAVGGTGSRDDMMTLALEMLAASAAVVAAQREALASVPRWPMTSEEYAAWWQNVYLRFLAPDAEEVSEPSPERETAHRVTDRGGSLTSPVDTAPGAKP